MPVICGKNNFEGNKIRTMKNIWNLEVGDTITFTNSTNYKVERLVTRVEEKSWYAPSRNSWGTLQSYTKYPDFKIIKGRNNIQINLKEEFEKETETPWINSQGEPDIDYVDWLEAKIITLDKQIRDLEEKNELSL